MRFLHIITGLLGIISGGVALYALKGTKLHRRSGMIFVGTMLVMAASGAVLAALKAENLNVTAGLLTIYLVISALFTVRRSQEFDWINAGTLLFGLMVCIIGVKLGVETLYSVKGTIDGVPPAVPFIFGSVALLGVIGDIRVLLRGIRGKYRIARHLWRMCFALWIAVASLFLGQPQVFPEAVHSLLVIPPLLVLGLMFYWLVRILFRQHPHQVTEKKTETVQINQGN